MLLTGLPFFLAVAVPSALPAHPVPPQSVAPPRIVEDPDRHATPPARIVPPQLTRRAPAPADADAEVVNKAINPAPVEAPAPVAPVAPNDGEVLEKGDINHDPIAPVEPVA